MINADVFRAEVIEHVRAHGVSYIDAMLSIIEKHGLEPEDADKLTNSAMTTQLEAEALKLNLIKGDTSNESKLVFE